MEIQRNTSQHILFSIVTDISDQKQTMRYIKKQKKKLLVDLICRVIEEVFRTEPT